jgi:hypothetical protein
MTWLLGIIFLLLAWSASLFDWMVNYATSFAQLGVWITLLSLISGWSFWTSLKKQPFTNISKSQSHVQWNVQLKS